MLDVIYFIIGLGVVLGGKYLVVDLETNSGGMYFLVVTGGK